MSTFPGIRAIFYRNLLTNRTIFYFMYALLAVFLLNLIWLNMDLFWVSTLFVIFLAFLQQYYYTFSMVEDKESGFKTTYKIMGLRKNDYFFGQLASFIATSAGILLFIISASYLTSLTKENKELVSESIYLAFFGVALLYITVLSCISILISYMFQKSSTARAFSIVIFLGFIVQAIIKKLGGFDSYFLLINPHAFYIHYIFEIFQNYEKVNYPVIFFYLSVQLFSYGILALYFEHVSGSGGDDHGKDWFFFLRKSQVFEKHVGLLDQEDLGNDDEKMKLRLRNLTKKFGSFTALNHINLDLELGKIHCLLGHNGAGKSTLINLITGIYKATSGSMFYKSFDLIKLFQEESNYLNVGIVKSGDILFNNMTVYQHFYMMFLIKKLTFNKEEIDRVVDELSLREYVDYKVSELSGGNKRKVSIGMALVGDPNILLFDEPTSALDAVSRQEIWSILLKIKEKASDKIILMTTHHLEEAEKIADEIIFLADGLVKVSGKIKDLKKVFGIGYMIEINSKEQRPAEYFESLLREFEKSLLNYKFKSENVQIYLQKMEIRVIIEDASSIQEIVRAIRLHFDSDLHISMSTNTFEKAYLAIEKQAHVYTSDVTDEQIPGILEKLYFKNQESRFRTIWSVLLIAKNKIIFLVHDTFQFIKMVIQYLFICTCIGFFTFYHSRGKLRIDPKNIIYLFYSFITIELMISSFSVYNLVYEEARSIKHTIFVNKVSPAGYYLGKILGDIFLNLIIYGLIFSVTYFLLLTLLEADQFTYMYLLLVYKFTVWKISFCCGGLFFSRFFKSERLVAITYPFFYVLMIWVLFLHGAIINTNDLVYLNDFALVLYTLNDPQTGFLRTSVYFGSYSLVYFLLAVLLETFKLRFNYKNSYQSEYGPINSINKNDKERINLETDLFKSVEKEKEETLSEESKKIKVINLSKSYKKNKKVLANVTFNVPDACNFGLVGPNGAGKSTLFNIILGKVAKTGGKLEISNSGYFPNWLTLFFKESPYKENNFGVSFQTETIWEELSVQDNLDFYAQLHSVDTHAFKLLLQYFEFDHFLKKRASELSSGNKRKLCLLNSLMIQPNILLYDEATAGVDLNMRLRLKRVFEWLRVNNKMASIFTTHFLKDIDVFCDRIGIIDKGKLIFIDNIENVKQDLGGYVIEIELNDFNKYEKYSSELSKFCSVRVIGKNQEQKKVKLSATQIKDIFDIFLYFCELERSKAIKTFSFNELSIEDIYVDLFYNSQ